MKPNCSACSVQAGPLFRVGAIGQGAPIPCMFSPSRASENQVLFSEMNPAGQLFALRSGLVKLVKSLESGKERILRLVFSGTIFGLEALSSSTHTTSAVTLKVSEICSVSRDEFMECVRANPDFALNVIHLLTEQFTVLEGEICSMSFKESRAKVATLLRSILPSDSNPSAGGMVLTLPFSCQEMGEILELSPETVSRTWKALERDGVIRKHGRKVLIRNVEALEKAARQ